MSCVRFSLLLLEFGEVYFEDFTVVFYPHVKQVEIEERYTKMMYVHVSLYLFYMTTAWIYVQLHFKSLIIIYGVLTLQEATWSIKSVFAFNFV